MDTKANRLRELLVCTRIGHWRGTYRTNGARYARTNILLAPTVELISEPNRVPMTNGRLDRLIETIGTRVAIGSRKDGHGSWQFEYAGRQLIIVTDEASFDRLRIMTPILVESDLAESELRVLLSANYDRAIDAKFAIAEGYLWSLYTHPLRALSDDQFLDAVEQVKTLADNYGDSYSSCDFKFEGH